VPTASSTDPAAPAAGASPSKASRAKMTENRRMMGNYELGALLGKGMSGKVKLATDTTTGERVALKLIDRTTMTPRQVSQLDLEIKAMKQLSHPNILALRHVDMDAQYPRSDGSSLNVSLLVLELATSGELFDFLMFTGAFQERIARTYAHQLYSALQACHQLNIYHRDIKPENLLLDANFQLKVADFGLSSIQETDQAVLQTECGTRSYMAPEVLAHTGYDGSLADVWSAGVVLFIMIAGNPPFQMATRRDWWFNAVSLGRYDRFWAAHLRSCPHFPQAAQELMNRIFTADASQRATVADVLADPWMRAEAPLSPGSLRDEMSRRKARVDADKAREREAAKARKRAQDAAAGSGGQRFDPFAGQTHRDVAAPVPDAPEDRELAHRTTFFTAEAAPAVVAKLREAMQAVDGAATVGGDEGAYTLRATLAVPGDVMEMEDERVELPGGAVQVEASLFGGDMDGALAVELLRLDGDVFLFDKLYRAVKEHMAELIVDAAAEGADEAAAAGAAPAPAGADADDLLAAPAAPPATAAAPAEGEVQETLLSDDLGMMT